MNISDHDVISEIEVRSAHTKAASTTSVRLHKLISQVTELWERDDYLKETSALTDKELLIKLAVSGAVMSAIDTREQRKLERRVAARVGFLANLKNFGGLYKVGQVAQIMGVSRQTVNNHITSGKLIAIKEGNDFFIPGFQFDEIGKLKYLEEILQLLSNASVEAKCTFFLNPISLPGGKQELPYEIMKNGCTQEELFLIKREAELFLTPTSS